MHQRAITKPEILPSSTLIRKLHPSRFPHMSPKMAAIVACILGQTFTDPSLVGITVTSDNHALGMNPGGCGFNAYLGHADDLRRNWNNLLHAADLTDTELSEAKALFETALRVGRNL